LFPPSTLSGSVYGDRNNDGVFGAAEAGVAGVTVRLTGSDFRGVAVDVSTTTAADGSYSFAGLPPGVYTLTEAQPAGYPDGKDTLGTVGGLADGNATVNDRFGRIVLPFDAAAVVYNFGEVPPAEVLGVVYVD